MSRPRTRGSAAALRDGSGWAVGGRPIWQPVAALALAVVVLALLLALPAFAPGYYVTLVTRMAIFAMFAVAFNIVFGLGGMHSLGHAAFFGLGGYTVGLGVVRWEWGFVTIILVALALGALMGLVFGVLTQRTDGIYLLLLTLALGQALWGLAFQQVALTRGDNGISGVAREVIPLVGTGRLSYYHFVLAVCLACILLMWAFVRSPVGQAIVGARESRPRMAALGYRVSVYRCIAFVVSGMFSAIAGALFVWHHRFVSPDVLDWPLSAMILIVAIVGGAATFAGPAVGAVVIIGLEFWVSLYTARWLTILGLVYVLTILFLPHGLLGVGQRFLRRMAGPRDGDAEQAQRREPQTAASGGDA